MLTVEPKNQYVELASRCYRRIEALAEPLGSEAGERVLGAALAFWSSLAWADDSLSIAEREIFLAIHPSGNPIEDSRIVDEHDLETLMAAVAAYDRDNATRLGRQIASQFESLGYAILASDRNITDREMATLQASMRRLHGALA